ncbi:proteasome regulatory particle base subunit [Entophlyctis luteolus]|nr:proteasome regulatory particle base subunit [Entophlyctis luteolus]KAJ3356486.1 proteasome regulatory particle base subunit [Entophlyctis luteolus]
MRFPVFAALLLAACAAAANALSASVSLAISARDGSDLTTKTLSVPKNSLAAPLVVGDDEALALSVSMDGGSKDDLVFAHFVHTEKKKVQTSFVLERASNGKLSLKLVRRTSVKADLTIHVSFHLSIAQDLAKKGAFIFNTIKSNPGVYTLSLLSTADTKATLKIGKVHFDISQMPEATILGASESFEPLPEIYHVFRKPEPMPNKNISYAFTALVVGAPWLLMIVSWFAMGVNVYGLFFTASNFIWGVAFLVSLAGSCAFFALYWYKLNLFQLFGYGSIVWSVLGLLGRQALIARASWRLREEKTKGAVSN